jgi:16S rRNA (cytosine967-C5)-methyltransferase
MPSESKIKFVNAVLRNIDRKGKEALEKTSFLDNIEPWLVKEWREAYGDEIAQIIAEASMKEPLIFISVNHGRESTAEDRRKKMDWIHEEFSMKEEAEILPHGSIRVPDCFYGSVSNWPLYQEGEWFVQDASASLPAIALHKTLSCEGQDVSNMHVVDLCSAPGGKTAQLCSLGFGKVTAVEISARRIKTLNDNLHRLDMEDRCEVIVADGTGWKSKEEESIEGVLVDAPCSATGLGSRRPDVLRKSPDLGDLTETQRALAVNAVDNILSPGGVMVYATCSLLRQESEDQMKWLLSRTSGAKVETVRFTPGEIPGFDEAIDENGWMRVLPGTLPGTLNQCDGFFVARMRRVS